MKVSQTMARECMPKCWATADWSGTCGNCSDPHVRYTAAMPSQQCLKPWCSIFQKCVWQVLRHGSIAFMDLRADCAAAMAGFKKRTFACASGYDASRCQ